MSKKGTLGHDLLIRLKMPEGAIYRISPRAAAKKDSVQGNESKFYQLHARVSKA